ELVEDERGRRVRVIQEQEPCLCQPAVVDLTHELVAALLELGFPPRVDLMLGLRGELLQPLPVPDEAVFERSMVGATAAWFVDRGREGPGHRTVPLAADPVERLE